MIGLIIIGDEILSGRRQDKHLSKAIELLGERGMALSWARYVGDDKPFSLFLASGVPFEVTTTPADHGWTFLCDHDARGGVRGAGTTFVARPGAAIEGVRALPEDLESIFAFKREILSRLEGVPYVVEDVPVVCAWYPTARAVMLWNLTESPQEVTLTCGKETRIQPLEALGAAWLEGVNQPH